jgi:hypothetical protein
LTGKLIEETYLIAAPLHASHKEDHSRNAQEASDKVDLRYDFTSTKTYRIDSRRREVEDEGKEEANGHPDATEKPTPTPTSMGRNKLTP